MSEVPSIRLEGLFGEIPLRSSGDFAVAADIEVPECEGLARAPLIVCVDLPSLGETALRAVRATLRALVDAPRPSAGAGAADDAAPGGGAAGGAPARPDAPGLGLSAASAPGDEVESSLVESGSLGGGLDSSRGSRASRAERAGSGAQWVRFVTVDHPRRAPRGDGGEADGFGAASAARLRLAADDDEPDAEDAADRDLCLEAIAALEPRALAAAAGGGRAPRSRRGASAALARARLELASAVASLAPAH
jgi:hypothetical protein